MSSLDQYVSASKIQERFGISSSSLRRWDRDGTINTIRTPGGFRLYKTSDVEQVFNQRETTNRKRKYATQEFLQNTKEVTSKGKSNTSKESFLHTKSSKTLAQDPTTNVVASKPFWTGFTKELSQKLLLPTKTGFVDIDLNLLNSSSRKLTQNSWFSVKMSRNKILPENLPTISSQSATTLWQRIIECAQQKTKENENSKPEKKQKTKKKEEKKPAGKAKRIRLFPNQNQKEILKKWFGTVRWTYNQCLTKVEKNGTPKTKKDLRAKCVNVDQFKNQDQWVLETPYDVRDEGMNDLLKAYKTNFAAEKKGFKIKYRTKKAESESIVIHSKHWKKAGVFHPKSFGTEPIRAAEPLPHKLQYDCRLQRTRLGEFFLCIPMPLQIRDENQVPKWLRIEEGIVALDPGVRTFATTYSPSGLAAEWGKGDIGRIYRLCHALDNLQSKWSQKEVRHRKRYKMKRAARRIRKKIRNLVDEVHKKFTKWIVEQHHTVLLPEFETQRMVRRANRRIGSKTARAMLGWSHYRFKQRLLNKTREYPWCKIVICDEHYTSKTCGNCGHLHMKLGSSKTFKCPQCYVEMDRDMNAARNILLRYATLNRANFSGLALGLTPVDSLNPMQDLDKGAQF